MDVSAVATIEQAVRALGNNFNLDALHATQAIYRPYLAGKPKHEAGREPVVEHLDLAYGPDPRHRLDLYLPSGPSRGVVIYIHGGGFIRGEKNDGEFYPNIGRFIAGAGFSCVIPNYRLAPAFKWPAATRDVQMTVAWVKGQDAADLLQGAQAKPLFLFGQSAGATHVASWLLDDEARGAPLCAGLSGVLLMSGFYNLIAPVAANIVDYFGDDPASYRQRSPLSYASRLDVPLWLSVAELDPPHFAARTYELAGTVANQAARNPEMVWFRGHNHISTVLSLGSPQTDVGREVLRFLETQSSASTAPPA